MTEQETLCTEILTELESGRLVLPMLPEVALRVNDVVGNPDATTADLAKVILMDVALSAQLIKVANSPLYRGRYPIDNVQMAVSRLGLKLVKNLVSGMAMEQIFQTTSHELEQRLHHLWQYCVDVAAIAHVLASKQPGIQADEAMLAGLIHNIGVLPILSMAVKRPALLQDPAMLDSVIKDLNTRLGVAILKMWAFPQGLIEVVSEHDNYTRDGKGGPDLVDIVQVAKLQSRFRPGPVPTEAELASVPAYRKLGVQADTHVAEMEENSEEYAAALALFGQTYADRYKRARQ